MYKRWTRKCDLDRYGEKYMISCYELFDEDGYSCDEYEIDIRSWHDDLHIKNAKVADSFSEYRYKMTFKNEAEANRIWKWVVDNEPDYKELESAGFKKSTW